MTELLDVTRDGEIIQSEDLSEKKNWKNVQLNDKIENLRFSGEVIISNPNTESGKLLFCNCIFDTISIKNVRKITEITFEKCSIDSITVFDSTSKVVLISSSAQSITLNQRDKKSEGIRLENSQVKDILLESGDSINSISIVNESDVEKLDNKDAKIEKIEIHSSHVGWIHIHNSINSLELKEGGRLDRFSIDSKDELKRFVQEMKNQKNTIRKKTVSVRKMELLHHHQIFLAAYNQYAEENKFQEMDICLIKLRKINCILGRMSTNNPLRKIGFVIEDIVLGLMFGWGVNIINSLVTSAAIIAVFALIYFQKLSGSMEMWECLRVSISSSVNRFFGVGDSITILSHFDTSEQIIGVIILTIFTGVIARKIIR